MQPDVLFGDAESAQELAQIVAGMVVTEKMPPFYAQETDECPNPWGFAKDTRLTEDEKDAIAAWAADGAPLGDPETAAPLPVAPSLDLKDSDLEIFPLGQYTTPVAGAVEDEFVCLSIDPDLSEQQWLEAFQVLPQDLTVVHHVLVGIDATGASASLTDANGVYPCFGGFGIPATFIGGWIPSASPTDFPPESAVRVPAGARIVLQMHYHLAAEEHSDGTGVALRWAEGTPVREAQVGLQGNAGQQNADGTGLQPGPNDTGEPSFFIPAGVEGHTETMYFDEFGEFLREVEIFLVANHMHYVGTDMRMWLERGDQSPEPNGTEACLLHTPEWDFDWQQFYYYDTTLAAPTLYPGDKLWLRCEFDNTLDNDGVVQALLDAGLEDPVDVGLGDGSLDEMCIAILGFTNAVNMKVDDETHAGPLAMQATSPAFGFDDPCNGPTSVQVTADGAISGLAACGLDVLGLLATIEISFSGTDHGDGTASGDLAVSAIGVAGGGAVAWNGTYAGDVLNITIDNTATFGGNDVHFSGTITAMKNP